MHSSWMVADLAALAIIVSGVLSPLGLGVSAFVALKLLPVRPSHRPQQRLGPDGRRSGWRCRSWRRSSSALPAIDAQLRLMARRYLGFRVTVKHRTHVAHTMR